MSGNSNSGIFIAAAVILIHFLVAFVFLIYKLNKKDDKKKE